MRRLIRQLALDRRMAVLVSSHLLAEIEQVCDRVAIIHRGRCLIQTGIHELRAHSSRLEIEVRAPPELVEQLRRETGAGEGHPGDPEGTTILIYREAPDAARLVRHLVQAGADVLRVQSRRESLEDVFLRLTGSGENDARIDAF
jgi:ABC-type multidrug transport system ATPase subunit